MKTRGFLISILILVVFSVGLFLLPGCATGPKFTKIDDIPEGKAVVYIYRPASPIGAAVSYQVIANGAHIMPMVNGGYFAYYAKPGENEFSAATETMSSVTLDVKTGQSYYIKSTVGVGMFVGRPRLAVMPADVGEKEIANCKCQGVRK